MCILLWIILSTISKRSQLKMVLNSFISFIVVSNISSNLRGIRLVVQSLWQLFYFFMMYINGCLILRFGWIDLEFQAVFDWFWFWCFYPLGHWKYSVSLFVKTWNASDRALRSSPQDWRTGPNWTVSPGPSDLFREGPIKNWLRPVKDWTGLVAV